MRTARWQPRPQSANEQLASVARKLELETDAASRQVHTSIRWVCEPPPVTRLHGLVGSPGTHAHILMRYGDTHSLAGPRRCPGPTGPLPHRARVRTGGFVH